MGLAKFSIYKCVKIAGGWRYCRPTYSAKSKIKPYSVLIDGQWEKVGVTPIRVQDAQTKRLARQI